MKLTVDMSCFGGHGILLMPLLLFFEIAAVPTSSTKPTPVLQDMTTSTSLLTTSDIANIVTSATTQDPQNSSLAPTPNLSLDTDPPAIVNNENVTETEIVITESRHGKSLHHHHNQQGLSTKNESINVTGVANSAPSSSSSEFTAKLAQDGDHVVQHLSEEEVDAPPKMGETDDAEGKPLELAEPRLLFVPPEPTVSTERDKMIQRIFGGECDFSHWNRCSRIEFWGGDYLVPDKHNPGKFLVKHHKIKCAESPKNTLCLRNGWTVERCHMLCMSQCNVDYRMNYEKLVSHEGDCRIPILRK